MGSGSSFVTISETAESWLLIGLPAVEPQSTFKNAVISL
jgi:hypothetical protein